MCTKKLTVAKNYITSDPFAGSGCFVSAMPFETVEISKTKIGRRQSDSQRPLFQKTGHGGYAVGGEALSVSVSAFFSVLCSSQRSW
jgi:hypothetical protein